MANLEPVAGSGNRIVIMVLNYLLELPMKQNGPIKKSKFLNKITLLLGSKKEMSIVQATNSLCYT